MSNIIVGLDIGTTKIACFIGQKGENGKATLLGYGKTESIGVERGVVRNVLYTTNSIRKAVQEASDQADVNVEDVYVGIAGQHIRSFQSKGSIFIKQNHRLIEEEDINNLIDNQYHMMLQPGEEIIHIFPQTYYIDGNELSSTLSPIGVAGNSLEATFHVITGNTENIRNIRYSVQDAGLKIKGLVLEPVASSYAVLNDIDKEAGVALVDIGGGTTDIAIFDQQIIRHTSVLPLAGNSISEDIRNTCSILKSQAESLKTKFGSCLPSNVRAEDIISIPGIRNQSPREISMKNLATIIHARTKIILEQVQYEIETSGLEKKLGGGIVLTGGGAKLNHIKELSDLITSINTRIGIPNEHIENTDETFAHPMYATGIGLVLYGIEQDEMENGKEQACEEENNDIFADMTETPRTEPEKEADNDTDDTAHGKKVLNSIKDYFKKILDDKLDEY